MCASDTLSRHSDPVCALAAKAQHPDVNAAPGAADAFKRLTAAYTQALLDNRQRDGQAERHAHRSASSSGGRSWYRGAAGSNGSEWSRPGGAVDPRLFNTRQWEAHHYGMHGAASHVTDRYTWQSQYASKLYRQHRGGRRAAAESAHSAASTAAAHSKPSSLSALLCSVAFAGFVWTCVYQTNVPRWREGGMGSGRPAPRVSTRRAGG